ncbi:MAG: MtrAB system histidine kinase MtrB [Nocardioidaceae bacterium]
MSGDGPSLGQRLWVATLTPLSRLVDLWRRSIQARVVIGTLLLSTVLTVLAGWILLRQVADGVLDSKRQAALTQAAAGIDTAQSELDAADVSNFFDAGSLLNQLIDVLAPRDDTRDDYSILIAGPYDATDGTSVTGGIKASETVDPRTIPEDLAAQVQSERGSWWVYTTIYPTEASEEPVPGIVVGSQINVSTGGTDYALYYVFPLTEQQQTLSVVRNALITTGALLVVLLGLVAWLVTRQVVTPVRLARRIAERLAAGRLEERMHVRGKDDIARLGVSFNQMATSLQRQIRQLEELSRVQRRFVADVSHELRTPLTTVRMAADVLHDAKVDFDPATARAAELLQSELNRFEGLLNDLLEISRFDAGAAVLDLTATDVRDVVRQVVDSARALAERKGSSIRIDAPVTPCVAEADVRRLDRVIRNLVVNAVAYGEGGDIDVAVAADAEAVAVSVRDHGVGLKPGEESLVFTRFWRADKARARTHGGTGLGLPIALEDAQLHGGTLEAWGEPGAGSLFRLTIPRRAGDPVRSSPLPLVPLDRATVVVGAPYARYPHRVERGRP